MTTPPSRPPLAEVELAATVTRQPPWRELRVVDVTPSTNADVAAAARAGVAEGLVVAAEHQSAGRGRLDRGWESPPRAGLTFSMLLRPGTPTAGWGWLPLLAGVAAARALREVADLDPALKWPNDVLVGGRKLGGVLAEVVGDAVVVGVGLNVTTTEDELPDERATSVLLAGGSTTAREPLLIALLASFGELYLDRHDDPARARAAYLPFAATPGRDVRLELPGGRTVEGRAEDVDDDGRLVVSGEAYGAGDVVHLRDDAAQGD